MAKITIQPLITTPSWHVEDGDDPTLQIASLNEFYASTGELVLPISGNGAGAFYVEVPLTLTSNNTVLNIPSIVIDSTSDSSLPVALYTATIWAQGRSVATLLQNFGVPATPSTTTWELLTLFMQFPMQLFATSPTDVQVRAWIDQAIGTLRTASVTQLGLTAISEAAADPAFPIAISETDARVPTIDQAEALVGTNGSPSSSNPYVTDSDPRIIIPGSAGDIPKKVDASGYAASNLNETGNDLTGEYYPDVGLGSVEFNTSSFKAGPNLSGGVSPSQGYILTVDETQMSFGPDGSPAFKVNPNARISRYGDANPVNGQTLVASGGEFIAAIPNLSNIRLAKTAAYSLANADKGKTVALGGSAYYTLTVGAASGFDANFTVVIINEDTVRAKLLAVNGLTSFYLYPQQSIILLNDNSTWKTIGRSRWAIPAGASIFVATTGNDANDGLAVGAPLLNPQTAINRLKSDCDFSNVVGGLPVIVKLADGTYSSSSSVIYTNGPWVGYQPPLTTFPNVNEMAVKIQGNTTTPASVVLNNSASDLGAMLVLDTWLSFEGVELISNGHGLQAAGGAVVVWTNVIFGATGATSAKVYTTHAATAESYGTFWVRGNSGEVFFADYNSSHFITGTIIFLSNITATDFAKSSRASTLDFPGATVNLNGFTFTGFKALANYVANITGGAAAGLPGTEPLVSGFSSYEGGSVTNAEYIGVLNTLDGNVAGSYLNDEPGNITRLGANLNPSGVVNSGLAAAAYQMTAANADSKHEWFSSSANDSVGSLRMTLDKSGQLSVTNKVLTTGGLGVGNSAAGSTPGTCVKKIEIFDENANSLGFLAVYDSVT